MHCYAEITKYDQFTLQFGTNCLAKSKCIEQNTRVCEDTCGKRGYRCLCERGFRGNNCQYKVKSNEDGNIATDGDEEEEEEEEEEEQKRK